MGTKESKLIFEYEGKVYRFNRSGEFGFCSIIEENGCQCPELNMKYWNFITEEEKKHEMDYWWESQVSLAKRAMEKEGAKILEFEDEEYEMTDKDGRPLFF